MPFIRLPLGIRVAMEYEYFGKVVVNVYHVTTPDPIITLKLLDVAQIFKAWWDAEQSLGMTTDIALAEVTAINLDEPNGEKLTLVVSPVIPGTQALEALPSNVALVASFSTAKTGRSFRGRSYMAGISESSVQANNLTVEGAAFFVASYGELIASLDSDNDTLVVASFQNLGEPRVLGVATPVNSVSVNTRVDTQRRRLPA